MLRAQESVGRQVGVFSLLHLACRLLYGRKHAVGSVCEVRDDPSLTLLVSLKTWIRTLNFARNRVGPKFVSFVLPVPLFQTFLFLPEFINQLLLNLLEQHVFVVHVHDQVFDRRMLYLMVASLSELMGRVTLNFLWHRETLSRLAKRSFFCKDHRATLEALRTLTVHKDRVQFIRLQTLQVVSDILRCLGFF